MLSWNQKRKTKLIIPSPELEADGMKINERLQGFVQYFTEGFARIFSPAKDDYQDIGVQPYDCKPYYPKPEANKT